MNWQNFGKQAKKASFPFTPIEDRVSYEPAHLRGFPASFPENHVECRQGDSGHMENRNRPLSDAAKTLLMRQMKWPRIDSVADEPCGSWESARRVYFIGAADGPIKIGWSVNPVQRAKSISTHHWQDMAVMAMIPGGPALERYLHSFYAREHLRGEWFRRSRRLMDFISWHASSQESAQPVREMF